MYDLNPRDTPRLQTHPIPEDLPCTQDFYKIQNISYPESLKDPSFETNRSRDFETHKTKSWTREFQTKVHGELYLSRMVDGRKHEV